MENDENELSNNDNNDKIDSSKIDSESKKKQVAKDLVNLKHVETQKQEVSKETKDLKKVLQEKGLDKELDDKLTNDEITILESFVGKRLFLRRIAIVINHSRMPLGIEPLKKQELEKLLDRLIHMEYINFDVVNNERVYFLTEKGKEMIQ